MCIAAVGLVGDIARALGPNVLNHSNLFMQILLENLAVSKRREAKLNLQLNREYTDML